MFRQIAFYSFYKETNNQIQLGCEHATGKKNVNTSKRLFHTILRAVCHDKNSIDVFGEKKEVI